jgi:hypothetical protein
LLRSRFLFSACKRPTHIAHLKINYFFFLIIALFFLLFFFPEPFFSNKIRAPRSRRHRDPDVAPSVGLPSRASAQPHRQPGSGDRAAKVAPIAERAPVSRKATESPGESRDRAVLVDRPFAPSTLIAPGFREKELFGKFTGRSPRKAAGSTWLFFSLRPVRRDSPGSFSSLPLVTGGGAPTETRGSAGAAAIYLVPLIMLLLCYYLHS